MKKSLGRGFSSLIAEQFQGDPATCPIGAIIPNPSQPRRTFDADSLEELAQSIKEHGVINPLLVRPGDHGKYILIAGERRLRAAKLAGLSEVPISIQLADDRKSLELSIIENIQREDISPLECASAYQQLTIEYHLTQEQIAGKVGRSRAAIANLLRLLKLPQPILDSLASGEITEGHARALLGADGPPVQIALLDKIIKENLNVRDTERLSSKAFDKACRRSVKTRNPNRELMIIEDKIAEVFGCPVTIQKAQKGGKIVLTFYSDDDLDRLIQCLLYQN